MLIAFEDEMAEGKREGEGIDAFTFDLIIPSQLGQSCSRRRRSLSNPSSRQSKLFRRRFRLPYLVFLHLLELVRERRWFLIRTEDVTGRKYIPLELKVNSTKAYRINEPH